MNGETLELFECRICTQPRVVQVASGVRWCETCGTLTSSGAGRVPVLLRARFGRGGLGVYAGSVDGDRDRVVGVEVEREFEPRVIEVAHPRDDG